MKMKSVFMGGVALLAMARVAVAADLPVKAAPAYAAPPSGFSWTGIYIGLQAGWETGANDITADKGIVGSTTVTPLTPLSNSASGAFGGGHIGYNYQFLPQWVISGRFDIDASGLSGTSNDANGNPFSRSVPWHSDAVARLGYLLGPQLMVYGLGGIAFGEVKDSAVVPFNNTITVETTNTHTGWVAGAGVEYYLTQSLSIGAEWKYFDLGTHGVTFVGTGAQGVQTFNTSDKAAWNSFGAFFSVKF